MKINIEDSAFVMICSALVFLMTPGLGLFYCGMVRRKNTLNTLICSFFICGLSSVMWILIGYSLSFGEDFYGIIGRMNFVAMLGVGTEPSSYAPHIPQLLFAAFQMMFAVSAPALMTGSLVERMKFSAIFLFIGLWLVLVYYPMVHMMWGNGGLINGLGAVDFSGGNVVHISSGVSGLVACIMLGKRSSYGKIAYRSSNIPLTVLGTGLIWFGWFGFNAGSALSPGPLAVHVFMLTNTSAAAGMLSWMFIEKIVQGKPTILGAVTGAIVGLVAITPGAGFVPLWSSILIGIVASLISYLFMGKIKYKLGYDDALDAFGCNGIGGIIGGIAVGVFGRNSINPTLKLNGIFYGDYKLLIDQILGITITIIFSGAMTFLIIKVMKKFIDIKVESSVEADGLDIAEHGESAYPAFSGFD
ncbi:ammonium transporter [Clostridium sp. C2-6-12]|uniref:ammonium transporter n=1 Tax=Clostridium sp. C2-6-12 TaxID=2698832 RepID=UPI001368DEDD|nr:ammonium transporter [Clostridium sp. C2-6-12]